HHFGSSMRAPLALAAISAIAACGSSTPTGSGPPPTSNFWSVKLNMPTPRRQFALGVVRDTVYVAGGDNAGALAVDAVEAYATASNSWSAGTAMPSPRSATGGDVINGILYVAGGYINT